MLDVRTGDGASGEGSVVTIEMGRGGVPMLLGMSLCPLTQISYGTFPVV